jgi:energy-coupling factor transport system substrate-specific component
LSRRSLGRARLAALLGLAALGALGAGAWAGLDSGRAGLALLLVAAALVAGAAALFEAGTDSTKEIAVVATLGGVAAAGRILFAAVPGVQPVTVITVAAGASFGLRVGVGVGATSALASNFVLGQGIWTPWQMLAWAGCGAAGALLAPILRRRLPFALVCCVLGFAFSFLMDVWQWFSFYPHTWQAFIAVVARGIPFDVAHAAGNLVLGLAAGPELMRLLGRYGRRLRSQVQWV